MMKAMNRRANTLKFSCWLIHTCVLVNSHMCGIPGGSVVKNLPANAGDAGLIPGSGRSSGEVSVNPLQYSCLRNPMDKVAWQGIVHGVVNESSMAY